MLNYRYITSFLLCCSVALLTGCSKPAKQNHEQTEQYTSTHTESTPTPVEEEFKEPENGIYEEAVEPEQSSGVASQHITDYDLKELMQKHAANPAAVEAGLFRMSARVVDVKTETDPSGERVAVVRLVHPLLNAEGKYNSAYELSISFFCLTSLEEAAQFQSGNVIKVIGQIVNTGEDVKFYHEGKPITAKYMHAACSVES